MTEQDKFLQKFFHGEPVTITSDQDGNDVPKTSRSGRGQTKNHSRWGGKRRKERRRNEHYIRLSDWQKKSPKEQLKELDSRLGKGQGAKKQRGKIQKQIEKN